MKVNFLSIIVLILLASSCKQQNIYKMQEGDILLQDYRCGALCDAIEAVTIGVDNACFSHIGIVFKKENQWQVLEAIGKDVHYTSLKDFLSRSFDEDGKERIWIARVKKQWQYLIPKVKKESVVYIGQPYDEKFIMGNNAYYCSELLYELFKKANKNQDFFNLESMTFKDPHTKQFLPVWKEYYQKLNCKIPEGELGINPAGISCSDKIAIVRKMGKVKKRE
jgi:hypothetical protein